MSMLSSSSFEGDAAPDVSLGARRPPGVLPLRLSYFRRAPELDGDADVAVPLACQAVGPIQRLPCRRRVVGQLEQVGVACFIHERPVRVLAAPSPCPLPLWGRGNQNASLSLGEGEGRGEGGAVFTHNPG
jgi:hypothetical protein